MARARLPGAPWLVSALVAVPCLVVVFGLMLRTREELAFKRLHAKLSEARERYLAGQWRRPARGARHRECNALREARELVEAFRAARERAGTGPSAAVDRALAGLRQSLECNVAFWPEEFPSRAVAGLDYGVHSKAVDELLARSKQAEPLACLALSLDGMALGYDLSSGGRELRASVAYGEVVRSAAAALRCAERASPDDVRALVSEYRALAAVVPPLQWTYVYQYLRDAEFEDTLFAGRPWVPRFWHPSAYYLTSGSSILPRLEQALRAAEHAASSTPEQSSFVEQLEALQRGVPPSMGGSLGTGIVARQSERASLLVRAVACALARVASDPTLRAEDVCGSTPQDRRALLFVRDGPEVRCYWPGENGRDEGGLGDDEGVRLRLERASLF